MSFSFSEKQPIMQRKDPRGLEHLTINTLLAQFPSSFDVVKHGQDDFIKTRVSINTRFPLTDKELLPVATTLLDEMKMIELAARNPNKWNISEEAIKRIKLIVIFSAPGTYYLMEKRDRHAGLVYAWGMERQRADLAVRFGIHVAGLQMQQDLSIFAKDDILDGFAKQLNDLRTFVQTTLKQSGIRFLYVGNPEEVAAIQKVLNVKSAFIPSSAVDIISGNTAQFDTYNQVEVLKTYLADRKSQFHEGDGIAFVMGFQAVRALRMCQQIAAIPPHITSYVFPTRTHEQGINQYAERETRGTLVRILEGKAGLTQIRYQLIGKTD